MNNYFMGQDGFSWFIGVVEDRADPKKSGRVRVRCLGYHSASTQEIPTADLPWASIMMPVTAGGNSGIGTSSHFLLEGTWVVGFFRDPAKQEPVIMGALPGVNTSKTTNFTIASSSAVGGQSKGGGFKDANEKYPTAKYVGKPDTNLLAQEKVSEHASHNATAPEGSLEGKLKYYENWTTASGTANHGKMVFDVDGTDIVEINDGGVAVTGELSATTLDINGTDIGATAAEINLLDGSAKSTSSITVADSDALIVIDGTTTKQIPASDIKTYAAGDSATKGFATAMAIAL